MENLQPIQALTIIKGISVNNIINLIQAGLAVTVSDNQMTPQEIAKLSRDASLMTNRLEALVDIACDV